MTPADPKTPAMRQWHAMKQQAPDAFLFFRLGDFYELFYDDATTAAPLLGLTLTARNKGAASEAAMCGVPHHQLENYAAKLVRTGRKVAVCDQMEDPRGAKGVVKRAITRIITPGAATLDSLLDPGQGNYLLALAPSPEPKSKVLCGALLEVTTGEFLTFAVPDGKSLPPLLASYAPRELVWPENLPPPVDLPPELSSLPLTRRPASHFHPQLARDTLTAHFAVVGLEGFGLDRDHPGIAAAGALLSYARDIQAGNVGQITRLRLLQAERALQLDPASLKNLEVLAGSRGERAGSLLSVLDQTRTAAGARLLRQTLAAPPVELKLINGRLRAVAELVGDEILRRDLHQLLGEIRDLERLASKCAWGRATPRDLAGLRGSLAPLPAARGALGECASEQLQEIGGLHPHLELHARLAKELSAEPPALLGDGGAIAAGVNAELDELRELQQGARDQLAAIEARERERTGINSLKVRFNSVFGYYLEVSKANLQKVPDDYQRKQTMVGAERYITPELKVLEEKLLTAESRCAALEAEAFAALLDAVRDEIARLQATAGQLALLDLLCGFAAAAIQGGYVQPEVTERGPLEIIGGRHPVVETLQPHFVPNDTRLDPKAQQIILLTGPNMGGKSTYLKQTGLIALMAHCGSFVPAARARVPLLTRIYTRVGAGDDLLTGRSTFMVEMAETAAILNGADAKSLVLLDEVGRGTATHDGLAIAWAVTEALHNGKPDERPLTIFATHYHELTELAATLERLKNFRVAVAEHGHDLIFLKRIEPGAADRSYGVAVARLAGLPAGVIARAKEVLDNLEAVEIGRDGRSRLGRHLEEGVRASDGSAQPLLFGSALSPGESEVIEKLRQLRAEELTPLQALNLLAEWGRKVRD
jgi:DNA mismatch repair protein MutS